MTSDTSAPPPHEAEPASQGDGAPATPLAPLGPPKVLLSPGFDRLLVENRISVLVSTYDAGKVFLLRAHGNSVNVHFVGFDKAMGIAVSPQRLMVGTRNGIRELYNMPAVIPRLPTSALATAQYDACYVPRTTHLTGDVQIHEMAFAGEELWFVNTRFSCLCTIGYPHSFRPRWIPPFIKGLSADDRCHLNGLAVVDGNVKYVTAFAVTDEPAGWRPTKATSGLIMEVPSGRIVTQGLSMPHSPRYYANHLWVLDSGRGTIGLVDPATGNGRTFAQMNGFTRGLDFFGSIAFIGLSRVRESNVFGGLPLTERIEEKDRFCGVQALNVSTGKIEGFIKFESGVNEIFAVQVLPPGMAYPHILEYDDELVDTCYSLAPDDLRLVRPQEPAAT